MGAFRDDAFGIRMLNCHAIKATMHRAFDTWAQNHPMISFLGAPPPLFLRFDALPPHTRNPPRPSRIRRRARAEVTDLCEETHQLHEGCEYAEVWVTPRNQSRTGGSNLASAIALPTFVELRLDPATSGPSLAHSQS